MSTNMREMLITVDDLKPGASFSAPNQGRCITPTTTPVHIKWVDDRHVFYTLPDSMGIKQTPIDRFLEILNQ